MSDRPKIRECLITLVEQRGPYKSICPSEVARTLGGEDWRNLMPIIRDIGAELATSGLIEVLQKGKVVNPQTAKGPIRYRLKHNSSEL